MFIKQLLVIGNSSNTITTNRAFDIGGEFDMDSLAGTVSLKLPLIDKNNEKYFENSDLVGLKNLSRYSAIKIYYQKFDIDPGEVTTDDLILVFNGYLDKNTPTRNKNDYYLSFECIGTLGFANQMCHLISNTTSTGKDWFDDMCKLTNFNAVIPKDDVLYRLNDKTRTLDVKWVGGNSLKEIFETMNSQYGIKIHQRGDGKVLVFDAFSFYDNVVTEWELMLGTSAFEINYGEHSAKVDMVIVLGYNGQKGIAVNPLVLDEKQGEWPDINDTSAYITEVFHREDIDNVLQLETIARNILFDKMKNNVIEVKTLFDPLMNIMDFAKVTDGEFYDGERFIIKKISWVISKTDCSITLTCFKSPLALSTESLVTDSEGFTDLRMLEIYKEEVAASENVW